tara:strand:- start:171 stop:371 length:201 start_codon:yes stop_codon:yes gene_type:complete
MKEEIYKALNLKYKAKQQEAKVNLDILLEMQVGVADHPDVVGTVDGLLKEYAEATELLSILRRRGI